MCRKSLVLLIILGIYKRVCETSSCIHAKNINHKLYHHVCDDTVRAILNEQEHERAVWYDSTAIYLARALFGSLILSLSSSVPPKHLKPIAYRDERVYTHIFPFLLCIYTFPFPTHFLFCAVHSCLVCSFFGAVPMHDAMCALFF